MASPSGATQPAVNVPAAQAARRTRPRRRGRTRGDVPGAMLLIAPLAIFMAVFFITPIVSLMTRAVWDPVVAVAFPQTARALAGWHDGTPPPEAFAAVARDILAADQAGTLGEAASRLNQDRSGMRALMLRTRRHLDDLSTDGKPLATPQDAQRELVAADERWSEAGTWSDLASALRPLTAAYLLRAVDRRRAADGGIVALPQEEGAYVPILARTFWISLVVTAIVVALGYPLTYWLAQLPERRQRRVLMAVLIPFWTSILVRIAAWMVVLPREGLVNRIGMSMHLFDSPLTLLYNRTGVIISMVHILIPFMVLPLFAVMRGIPPTYQRAAISLGSHPFGAFWRVYVPQTAPGVAAGALLVFISALGYYIAPALLGGAGDQMLSYYIAYFTNTSINWGLAAALSVLLLVATALLFAVYRLLAAWRPGAAKEA
ncbi:ABC transporter permease [Caballeronia sp. LZ035]|uniref:ABC transporter permease n=1 Tax=Caballeronia sp. LZ035 TaxID=3038568 RepID=UPI002860FAF5|nr:ABC transporter permease [Caballeronia sp. LZ035]MDR5759001.1 ABC transporter permease [Caballeronia sp. LZ035]